MSLDTKYRPLRYADVLGQEATIKVCKEYVRSGHGFRQSYVFAGGHGGGKTTLGRILARALLCEAPVDGEPCDACPSCVSMLSDKSESFVEVDAATNSGKDDVRRITEEAQFGSFSGNRKIYLFDECHELSRQAMDSMLKPLEDNIRGTQDKQLVTIFCTTEPEKMRSAILSRCAPLFRIRPNTPQEIGERLVHICASEGIEYDDQVLPLIAEVCECHVRDAIKAVEGVSMLGKVDRENVFAYLHMDANALYLDLLESIGFDLEKVIATTDALDAKVSPATCYEKMADICMLAYRLSKFGSASVPSYWNRERLEKAGSLHSEFLVNFAQRFAERPAHASSSMFVCDVSALHQARAGIKVAAASTVTVEVPSSRPSAPAADSPPATPEPPTLSGTERVSDREISPAIEGQPKVAQERAADAENQETSFGSVPTESFVTKMGVGLNPLAQNRHRAHQSSRTPVGDIPDLSVVAFAEILRRRVVELTEKRSNNARSTGFDDMGGS